MSHTEEYVKEIWGEIGELRMQFRELLMVLEDIRDKMPPNKEGDDDGS